MSGMPSKSLRLSLMPSDSLHWFLVFTILFINLEFIYKRDTFSLYNSLFQGIFIFAGELHSSKIKADNFSHFCAVTGSKTDPRIE